MVIHAVYENGIFRPIEPVELPDNCQVELMIHQPGSRGAQVPVAAPLAGIAAIAGQHPENPNLPTDLAEQHDHYLYGTAKRS
jgi:predicted DNA-binding antitoxin AbrB/MazE fold protein